MSTHVNRVFGTVSAEDAKYERIPYNARCAGELVNGLTLEGDFKGHLGLEDLLNHEVIVTYTPRFASSGGKKLDIIKGTLRLYDIQTHRFPGSGEMRTFNLIKLILEKEAVGKKKMETEEMIFIDGTRYDLAQDPANKALGLIKSIKPVNPTIIKRKAPNMQTGV